MPRYECEDCGQRWRASSSRRCPECGSRDVVELVESRKTSLSTFLGCVFGPVILLLVCSGIINSLGKPSAAPNQLAQPVNKPAAPPPPPVTKVEPKAPPVQEPAQKWYEGGSLLKKSPLAWQKATRADKLATSGELLMRLWSQGKLAPHIQDNVKQLDDLKPWAERLTDELDLAFKADPDPGKNIEMYGELEVTTAATLLLFIMKWAK